MKNSEFITQLCEILKDDFFLCDMIYQEELFEMQDQLANLICQAANDGLPMAKQMIKNFPRTFKIEKL